MATLAREGRAEESSNPYGNKATAVRDRFRAVGGRPPRPHRDDWRSASRRSARAPLIQSRIAWSSAEPGAKRMPPAWAFLVGSFWASASSAGSHVGLFASRLAA